MEFNELSNKVMDWQLKFNKIIRFIVQVFVLFVSSFVNESSVEGRASVVVAALHAFSIISGCFFRSMGDFVVKNIFCSDLFGLGFGKAFALFRFNII